MDSLYQPSGDISIASGVDGNIDDILQSKLNVIGQQYGKPFTVTSGYRDPQKNKSVRGADNSAHLRHKAVDIKLSDPTIEDTNNFINIASKNGIGGIGVYSPGVIHLDIEGKRAWGPNYHIDSVPAWAKDSISAHLMGNPLINPLPNINNTESNDQGDEVSQPAPYKPDYANMPYNTTNSPSNANTALNTSPDIYSAILEPFTAAFSPKISSEGKLKLANLIQEDSFIFPLLDGRNKGHRLTKVSARFKTNSGKNIVSPFNGVIQSYDAQKCGGELIIRHIFAGNIYYTKICGVLCSKKINDRVMQGDTVGVVSRNNEITMEILDNTGKLVPLNKFFSNPEIKKPEGKKLEIKKQSEPRQKKEFKIPKHNVYDIATLPFTLPMKAAHGLLNRTSSSKVSEEIIRIKGLLK